MTRRSFALVASDTPEAKEAKARLDARYDTADVVSGLVPKDGVRTVQDGRALTTSVQTGVDPASAPAFH